MTVDVLITTVLVQIRKEFYGDRVREFKRDELALTKAIARYGYECHRRGWSFEPSFIRGEIHRLLASMSTRRDQIEYLPLYLQSAVDRHIGCRAEELAERSRRIQAKIEAAIRQAKRLPTRSTPSAVETLAILYRDLARRKRIARPLQPFCRQPELF